MSAKLKSSVEGIYILRCVVNGRRYIGSSSVSVRERYKCHIRKLSRNTHSNYRLQKDFNLYGAKAFNFQFIATTNSLDLEYKLMNNYSFYYNLVRDKSKIAYHKGMKRTQATKDKISKALTGKKLSKEHIAKLKLIDKSYLKGLQINRSRMLGRLNHSVKPIYQYTKNLTFVKEWLDGANNIKKQTGVDIKNAVIGRAKTAGGYIWKYNKI